MSFNHYGVEDFSCDIDKSITYLGHIHEHFSEIANRDKHGRIILEEDEANLFGWLLVDSLKVIYDIQKALYSEDSKHELAVNAAMGK